jgi:hypothetical protein
MKDRVLPKRKFQVSNGYLLEFEQLARVLSYLTTRNQAKKVSRNELKENTGLSNRQLESLISVGSAMGLINVGRQTLTTIGFLVAKHDVFMESRGSLEWCHYIGAGSRKNLIWYDIFNVLLLKEQPFTQEGLTQALRNIYSAKYTARTIGKHLHEEVRFVIDAYVNRNFKKLGLLHQATDGTLYRRRSGDINRRVFSAVLYDYAQRQAANLLQVKDLLDKEGSPVAIFAIDEAVFKNIIEELHHDGLIRYEGTHDLDQIRLTEGFQAMDFLIAYYEDKNPLPGSRQENKEQLL